MEARTPAVDNVARAIDHLTASADGRVERLAIYYR
jgi:hypothetical protein